jgi:hypothetical protein
MDPAKIVRKTLIPTVLRLLLDFLSLKNDVNVPSKVVSRKTFFKLVFCWRHEGRHGPGTQLTRYECIIIVDKRQCKMSSSKKK